MSKTAIITGALGNLGMATTEAFVAHDFHVIGLDKLDRAAEAEGSPRVRYEGIDLSDAEATHAQLQALAKDAGPIQAAVMIAGGFGMGSVVDTPIAEVRQMMALNFETAYNATQALWPYMANGGRFVYIGAKPALEPAAGQGMAAYALSKSLVFRLAEMVNEAGKEAGLSASVIVPSIIDTPPNREAMPQANFEDWVRPEEIGEMIAYLCDEGGRAVRNTTLKMYGNS